MPEKRTRKRTTDVTKEKREDEEAKASLLLQWRSFFEAKQHHHRRRKRCGLHPHWEEKEWKPLRIKSSEDEEDDEQLPSREEIISQFGLFGGSKCEDSSERYCEIDFTTGTCANGEKCERGVVQHIKERCMEKEIGKTRVVVVLELGARDGTFARAFVREWTDERTRLEYFACDSAPKDASVTKRDASEAIREIGKKYEGRDSDTLCIALVSWMPFQIDWTREIRKHAAFDEYILIGEGEGGICGSKQTFGREDESDDQSDGDDEKEGEEDDVPALYEREGFVMRELEKVKNLGKSDTTYEREGTHSKTISFRRRVDIQ
ncbi:unnamed protein product [Bathycoccus prasinos]